MPLSSDEPICPKFQPNIFDPLRCHDCLRQRHLHAGAGESTEAAQQKSTAGTGNESGAGTGKGVLLTPIPSQTEDKDTSSKDDSDSLSVVSSNCDVNRGHLGYGESSLCILSPDCELYICDGDDDDSTDSCRDHSDYQEFSGSVSGEDEYLLIHPHSNKRGMTRLDRPPHRPNPRAWMDEAPSRDGFTRRSGIKDDREKRESGYFSLGRAAGAHLLRDNSPPAPFRHFERGRPVFNSRHIEPKDTVPFRNPNLGVASERQIPETTTDDLPEEIPPPDPYEIAIEVEAQVGPRSPSPTPFKIAESLPSTGRKGFSSSFGQGNPASSAHQSGRFDSSKYSSAMHSRSSSPSRGHLPFRRTESTASLNRHNLDGGGWSQRMEPGSISSLQSTHAQRFESGTLPRNFKTLAGSLKSQSSTVSDFRSALRKTEGNGSCRSQESRSSSPSRRDCNTKNQISRHKTDTASGSPLGRIRDSRTSSPSRRNSEGWNDSRSSSPPRRHYSSSGQSRLYKSESILSLNGRGHHGRCGSPIREGYDIESQALLRTSTSRNGLNDQEQELESPAMSTPRRGYAAQSQSILRKTESNTVSINRGRESRCSSPGRRGYETHSQYQLRKTDNRSSLNSSSRGSRNSSPSRRSYEAPSHSLLRKSEGNSSIRSRDSQSLSPSRKSYDVTDQQPLRKTQTNSSVHSKKHNSRNSSPSGKGNSDPPGYSVLRNTTNGDSSRSVHRKSAYNDSKSDSKHSWRELPSSPRSSSLSRATSPSRQTTNGDSSRSFHRKSAYNDSKSDSKHSWLELPSSPRSSSLSHATSPSRQTTNGDSSRSVHRKSAYNDSKSDSKHSWRELPSSPRSSSLSHATSPSRQTKNGSRISFATLETPRSPSSIRSVDGKRNLEDHRLSPRDNRPSHRVRSPSPLPQTQMRRHTSSQSSMESSESGQLSAGSTGRNKEEYAILADLPKVKKIHQMEGPGHTGRTQNQQPLRRQELFKPASHSLSKQPSREWEETVDTEREWHHTGSGYLSRAHSSTSLQRSGSPSADEGSSWKGAHHRSEQMQPDLLNFKKGWMSKLDDSGEWKKHWFVLTDAGLKYYRDSSAEENDDMDGEIDLKSCVKVSEFDVEKNYGFQIQTKEAAFTLSAMTAGIRRNWIEVLKKCIRPSSSPDITQLPDGSSDKENSSSRFLLSSRRPSSRYSDIQSESPSFTPTQRRFDYVELSPVPASSSPLPTNQREAGEGQGREHSQWQEERNTSSQWEALLSRKGTSMGSKQRPRVEDEIEKKWAEFERMPLKEMSALPSMGSRPFSQSANEALQREVASLRPQLGELQQGGRGGGRGGREGEVGGVQGGCGPEALCGRSLAAMERAHRQALEELQRQYDRQLRELEAEKERLLLEEAQDTAQVMEALKKKHKEELEREVERVKRLSSGMLDSHTLRAQQQTEAQSLQRELAGLSERYSQKCLELNRAEQNNAEREREISRKERDMEQLRRENQGLKARLAEEVSRFGSITDQGSQDNKDEIPCQLEVLLRVKENEIEYLHKEISCLRNELQFLNAEKRLACERYTEVNEELSSMKGRNEREIQSLKEHLKLAMAALQEGQKLGNSLDH